MSSPSSPSPARGGAQTNYMIPLLVVGVVGLVTLLLLFLTNGNPAAALAPVLGLTLLWVLFKTPLRTSFLVLVFLVFTLENPIEPFVEGRWETFMTVIGGLLMTQLKHTLHVDALVITGIDVVLFIFFCIHIYRRLVDARIDRVGAVPLPKPIIWASWAGLVGTVLPWVLGLLSGGENRYALWQVQHVVYLPLVVMMAGSILPSPKIYLPFAQLLVLASCIKATLAIALRFKFPEVEYTTSHSDSMIFGTTTCMLLFNLYQRWDRRSLLMCVLFLPLIGWGMLANDRRLVWVEIALALGFAFAISPRTRLKTRFLRAVIVAVPVLALYVAIGYRYPRGPFRPVAMLRSMEDASSDSSSLWREFENFHLVTTVKNHPIWGTGWGRPYEIAAGVTDTSTVYPLEPYVPHNSLVGLWAYTGYVGFTLLWALPIVGCFFAARAYRLAREPDDRTAMLTVLGSVLIYGLQCYGDIGLGTFISVFLIAPAIVIAGKLAVALGGWPRLGVTEPEKRAPGSALATRSDS